MATQSKSLTVSFLGEADSYALARVDFESHASLGERFENVFLIEQGGMELAPGTQFLRATPGNGAAILRPWVFSIESAFALELSDDLVRFIADDGYVTLTGAAATVATFTDETAIAPSGGGTPPTGDGGSGYDPPPEGSGCVWIEFGEGSSGGYWFCVP